MLGILGVGLLSLLLLGVFGYLVTFLGPGAVAVGFVAALFPLGIVLAAVAWIDRWEPEPRLALVFAFLWGAAAAVAIALIVDLGVQVAAMVSGGQDTGMFLQATVQAPIVEEAAKGIGLLLVFFVARKHFSGPVDGLVYAAVIAAGFAFTENIQYFGLALVEGGVDDLGLTFFVRAVMSPFAHATFTALTGLALGLAARRHAGGGATWYFLVGLDRGHPPARTLERFDVHRHVAGIVCVVLRPRAGTDLRCTHRHHRPRSPSRDPPDRGATG